MTEGVYFIGVDFGAIPYDKSVAVLCRRFDDGRIEIVQELEVHREYSKKAREQLAARNLPTSYIIGPLPFPEEK